MYTSFYNLDKKPFQISSDPAFIWLGEKHKEALATLRYGILDNKGFLLLTGDVGTGKTTLINTLISSLTEDVILASVPDPRLESLDFFNYIAVAFGLDEEFSTKGKFVIRFSEFLHNAFNNNKKVLLIIDEAQLLSQDLLEEIRLLSNINVQNSQILNIFFVGQNEFNEVIGREENRAVSNRLTLNYHLGPLTLGETEQYIQHRLNVAGAVSRIFKKAAIKQIFDYSGGLPRRINILCDHCLITGFVAEKTIIDESDVKKSIQDLSIPQYSAGKSVQTTGDRQAANVSGKADGGSTENRGGNNSKELLYGKLTVTCLLLILTAGLLIYLFPDRFINVYTSLIKHQFPVISGQAEVPGNKHEVSNKEIFVESSAPEPKKEDDGGVLKASVKENDAINSIPETPGTASVVPEAHVSPDESLPAISDNSVVNQDEGYKEQEDVQPVRTSLALGQPVGEELGSVAGNNEKSPVVTNTELAPQMPESHLVIRFQENGIDFNSFDVELLEGYVDYLKASPSSVVLIAGHTDSSGSVGFNLRLSEFRAEVVKSYLIGKGISPSQTRVEGFGPISPVAGNDTEEGRRLNRRVEVSFLPQ